MENRIDIAILALLLSMLGLLGYCLCSDGATDVPEASMISNDGLPPRISEPGFPAAGIERTDTRGDLRIIAIPQPRIPFPKTLDSADEGQNDKKKRSYLPEQGNWR